MNLADRVRVWSRRRPDRDALADDHRALSYADLAAEVDGLTRSLRHRLDVGPGDRLAVLASNRVETFVTLFAAARLGAIVVPLNTRLAPAELAWILGDAEPTVLVAEAALLSPLADHVASTPGAPPLPTLVDPDRDWPALTRAEAAGVVEQSAGPEPSPEGTLADDVLVVYTSGTTGHPKGAVLTQAAVAANAVNAVHFVDLRADDVTLGVLPLFHVGGLNMIAVPALLSGAAVRLHGRFDPDRWLSDVERHRPAHSILVPAMMAAVIGRPGWERADLSSLRLLVTGSTFVPPSLIEAFHARGVPVCQIYGATETSPIALHQRVDEAFDHVGTVGQEAVASELRIVTPSGPGSDREFVDVAPGEPGELWVRGANVFRGYWRNEEATAAALTDDGWFRTGDVGYRRDDGHVVICDRLKDMLISGGENVYPAELEQLLDEMDEIAEATVIGVPDERWGEVAMALIVLRPGHQLDRATVLGRFDGRLARFKHPRHVRFVDSLPRNAMGKVRKSDLRVAIADDASAMVDDASGAPA
ncbi:MAG: AMP-binding protein [Actinomycetota bacterium]|nr:AMP-binding protein [Actinomycetota bacterium]